MFRLFCQVVCLVSRCRAVAFQLFEIFFGMFNWLGSLVLFVHFLLFIVIVCAVHWFWVTCCRTPVLHFAPVDKQKLTFTDFLYKFFLLTLKTNCQVYSVISSVSKLYSYIYKTVQHSQLSLITQYRFLFRNICMCDFNIHF